MTLEKIYPTVWQLAKFVKYPRMFVATCFLTTYVIYKNKILTITQGLFHVDKQLYRIKDTSRIRKEIS